MRGNWFITTPICQQLFKKQRNRSRSPAAGAVAADLIPMSKAITGELVKHQILG
jgi:hypothetical protein